MHMTRRYLMLLALVSASCARTTSEPSDDVGRDLPTDGRPDGLLRDRAPDTGKCRAGECLIGDACFATDARDPADPCHVCDPALTPTGWSPAKGCVVTLAGGAKGFADGPALAARFNTPEEVAVDGAGRVYIADSANNRIRVLYRGQVTTLAGNGLPGHADGPASSALFWYPHGVTVYGSTSATRTTTSSG